MKHDIIQYEKGKYQWPEIRCPAWWHCHPFATLQ